jgi:hypothetical protein
MGQSTDAILMYGFPVKEGSNTHERICNDDADDGSEDDGSLAGMAYHGGADANGVELQCHCHHEYPMWFVGIAVSHVRAWRGHPQRVSTNTPNHHWDAALRAFKAKHDIPDDDTDGPVGWWLFSYWG